MVCRKSFGICKRSRLYNRYIQIRNDISDEFVRTVETDILVNDLVKTIYLVNLTRGLNTMSLSNGSTEWLCSRAEIQDTLQSANSYKLVDRSFFPENPKVILAYLIFSVDHKILGRGGFAACTSNDVQSVFIAKLYGSLSVLEAL